EQLIEPAIDRLILGSGPKQSHLVVLEAKLARSAVVGDGKEGLQPGERPLVDPFDEALHGPDQAAVRHEHDGQHRRQRRRHDTLLNAHSGAVLACRDVDLTGDAGADGIELRARRMADADRVDGDLRAVAEGYDIAVGGEAPPELSRNRKSVSAR